MMKTKQIPAMIMLAAGLVACIAGIAGRMEAFRFTKMLLAVLVVFYIIGCLVKLIIDRTFKEEKEDTAEEKDAAADETEDSQNAAETQEEK